MKQFIALLLFASVLISCGSSQTNEAETNPNAPYTVYENINVKAIYQNMPKGIFIQRLSGPREMYRVRTPLEDGKNYRVTIRVNNQGSEKYKEAEIIAHTML